MKRIASMSIFSLFVLSAAIAQPVLNFDRHALKADEDNPMSYCEYEEAGISGANITWNFSDLQFTRSFTGYLKNSAATKIGVTFSEANTELTEFDSKFYFRVDQNKIEQYGYASTDGRMQTRYDIPFIKMKFPFSYGDFFSGSFSGKTYFSGIERGDMTGTYSVEADAFGTLILPGNTLYENTLRIRTEKRYSSTYQNQVSQEMSVITYRWYNESHRYPLLVLTEYTVKSGDVITTNYQAAYNNNAINFISPVIAESLVLYPNPADSYLAVEFDAVAAGSLAFTINDAAGKTARTFSRDILTGGKQYYDLSERIHGLRPGTYYLTVQNGNEIIDRNFTLVK